MSFPNSNRIDTPINRQHFWTVLARIQETLELTDFDFSKLLQMDVAQYQTLRTNVIPLGIDRIIGLCNHLGLSVSHFLTSSIDYKVLHQKFFSSRASLPELYAQNAFGTLSTFRAATQYLSLTRSAPILNTVLSSLQIDVGVLNDTNTRVNIRFYEDATDKMFKVGLSLDEFREIGIIAASENLRKLKNLPEAIELYAKLPPLERSLKIALDVSDRNHHYKIEKIKSDHALVSVTPTEESKTSFKREILGNKYTSILKEGIFSGMAYFMREKIKLETRLIQSIHQGDRHCLYEIRVV